MIDQAFQFFIQHVSFNTLITPVLIIAATIALIWFIRPGFILGTVLAIAGFVLAIISSPLLWGMLVMFGLAIVVIIFTSDGIADVPGQPSPNRAEIHYRLDVNLMVDGEPISGSVTHALKRIVGMQA